MKLSRFGVPDHDKIGVLLDIGRRVEDLAFGADYDRYFIDGVAMSIQ